MDVNIEFLLYPTTKQKIEQKMARVKIQKLDLVMNFYICFSQIRSFELLFFKVLQLSRRRNRFQRKIMSWYYKTVPTI